MNQLIWPLSNSAYWKALLFNPISTLITLGNSFLNRYTRCLVSIRASLNKWNIQVKANLVDVISCLVVVKCIDYQVEFAEEAKAEPVLLYFPDVVSDLNVRILGTNRLF